jgi:hypothetical protein
MPRVTEKVSRAEEIDNVGKGDSGVYFKSAENRSR